MPKPNFLDPVLDQFINLEWIDRWRRPCRPRILIVTDGGLSFLPGQPFGLSRFIESITTAQGVTNRPALTLAHRTAHASSVQIGTASYQVLTGFTFKDQATPGRADVLVTRANFDQVWLFGISTGAFPLQPAEVAVLSEFMNSGGGVFATGDHAALGRGMCGALPRIRHMREWREADNGGIPMGNEAAPVPVRERIDTIVDPGADGVYQFEDQSDGIPQRIYPNYRVVNHPVLPSPAWQATVHPLLRLPRAPETRRSDAAGGASSGFTLDIDVLPDHAHESVCYEVTDPQVLNGTYTVQGQSFDEFQPDAADPSGRVGSEIVAYAVSGGRSVLNLVWKPPVRPRMFGVIAAYDGRRALPYSGKSQRPGRIVCDSTWHHFLNINLDGTGTARTGLGSGSGETFTPSPHLEKIYAYYRNIISWLQPADRVMCSIFWDLVPLKMHPIMFEELIDIARLKTWPEKVTLGRQARLQLDAWFGSGHVRDHITGMLQSIVEGRTFGDEIAAGLLRTSAIDAEELVDGVLGAQLALIASLLPDSQDTERLKDVLGKGPEPYAEDLRAVALESVQQGVAHHRQRAERQLEALKAFGRPAG